VPIDKKKPLKGKNSSAPASGLKQTASVYSKKTALLEEAITEMNAGKYGRSSSALKELLAMDPHNMEARRLFATLHLRLGSLIPARQAFDSLIDEAFTRQDYWLAESLLREYLAAGPRCVPYLERLGLIYQDKGEVNEAVEQYGKAIDILIEDPDPDNPDHAAHLYKTIKDLAPVSVVATRVAGYFDAQTGCLIAQPSSEAEIDSVGSEEGFEERSEVSLDSEPVADIGSWGKMEEPLPVEEPDVAVQDSEQPPQDSELSLQDSEPVADIGLWSKTEEALPVEETDAGVQDPELLQQDSELSLQDSEPLPDESEFTRSEEVPEAGGDIEVCDPSVMVSDAEQMESEQASSLQDETDGLTLQTTDSPDSFPQENPPEAEEPTVQDSMSWVEEQETQSGMPSNTVTAESSEPRLSAPEPEQIESGASLDTAKKGSFSWDSVFKNVWNRSNEGSPPTTTPIMGIPSVEVPPLPKPSATEAPSSGGAPMPWDQVQDSTIRISPRQTEEEGSAESPIAPARPSENSTETASWAFQQPVTEEDRPLFLIQPGGETTESHDTPINLSLTDQAVVETEPAADTMSPVQSSGTPSADLQGTKSKPFSFSFFSEKQTATEDASSDPVWNPIGQSVTEDETESLPPQDQNDSFSLGGESGKTSSESSADGSWEGAILNDHPTSGDVGGQSPHIERHISQERETSLSALRQIQSDEQSNPPLIQAKAAIPQPSPQFEEERSKPEEAIRFIGDSPAVSVAGKGQKPSLLRELKVDGSRSAGASAGSMYVDPSSDHAAHAEPLERPARPRPRRKGPGLFSRIGASISSFIGSCFSTTRAIVMLVVALTVLSCLVVGLGVGAVGVTWIILEESPSPTYQAFTVSPPRTMSDPNKNGYVLLSGFDTPAGQSPDFVEDERGAEGLNADPVLACLGNGVDGENTTKSNVSGKILGGWFRGADPVGQFRTNQGAIGRWVSQEKGMLSRYRRWQKLPFEDWGYGRSVALPCGTINFAHRLYVAEGFAEQTAVGITRLEMDMEAWRTVMAQAKTLPVKVLAIQAVRDDAAVASGLLGRPEFDDTYVSRLSHMLRPLSQEELAIRWPMQSELVRAAKTLDAQIQAKKQNGQSMQAAVASVLPLPSQRRLNSYAAYYETANQASEAGRHGELPKLAGFIKSPASTVTDSFMNPIENVIGIDPLPTWDTYSGLVVDADAHLRLASLQAWIRRGWQDTELLSRIAKAGQTFYDPYTGMPMLVNLKKRLLYSVGHDLKDQDGDPQDDVVVSIPGNPAFK